MKRSVIAIVLAFFVLSPVLAQEKKEIKAIQSSAENIEQKGSYTPSFKPDESKKAPKNIILMIGDGMSPISVAAAMFINGNELTMTNLHSIGQVRTQSANSFVTDSAASATAYATGTKTNNGSLGVGSDKAPLPNIPEKVSGLGIACGVVTTDQVTGATPGAFYAHQPSRKMVPEIWGDLALSKLTFVAGGSNSAYKEVKAETRAAIENEFTVVNTPDDSRIADSKRLVFLPSTKTFATDAPEQYLPATTEMAIDYLSKHAAKGKGFFLMVEGSRIDGGGHGNSADKLVKEILYFDKAVEAAVKFAEKDGNTLVLVTADHETGGVSLDGKGSKIGEKIVCNFSTRSHSGMPVMIYAYGPHSRDFSCVQENSDVSNKICKLLGGK